MTGFLKNTSLYKLPDNQATPILHKEVISAELIFLLHLDVDIQPEIVEMLDKICAALKMSKEQVEYLSFKDKVSLIDIQQLYHGKNLVVFGAEPEDLNIQLNIAPYRVTSFSHFNLLLVNEVLDIYGNQQLKAKLWASLQEMFK